MPSLSTSGSTDLYLNVEGVGSYSATIPYNITLIGLREATNLIELGVARAVEWFVSEYMHLRFDPRYARMHLGYKILGSTWRKKQRRAERGKPDAINPNVWSGETKRSVESNTRVVTTAKGGRTKLTIGARIVFNYPGYVNQQQGGMTRQCLQKITTSEAGRIAKHFFEEMSAMASRFVSSTTMTRLGTISTRTSAAQVDELNFGRTSRSTVIVSRKSAAGGSYGGA